jgi:hypothetical protein
MLADELEQVLIRLRDGVRQPVSLECSCENFETVYVHLDETGGIRVDDRRRTFQYLHRSGDDTYVPFEELDLEAMRAAVHDFGVNLLDAPADDYASIECRLGAAQRVSDAVDRVSKAIDAVFHIALRADLK